MAEQTNFKGSMFYSLGGAFLISLVTEVVTGNHYWKTLSGISLVAIIGILFVAWTQFWTTSWAVLESQDLRVKRVAYAASLFVTLVMIINAGFVLYTRNKENKEDVNARRETARLQSTAATLKGLDPEVAKELLRQQSQQKQLEWEERQKTEAMNATGRKEETSITDIAEGYMEFWVFVIPFFAAALSKFTVLAFIALPGGASGFLPWKKSGLSSASSSSSSAAAGAPTPPTPPGPPGGGPSRPTLDLEERLRERARAGGGPGGRPNA